MTQPSDEAKDEIVSAALAHEQFEQEHAHITQEMPSELDPATLDRLDEPS
ncbi:MAG: hypothetical protein WAS07_07905 [Micropruina sp.]|nr:hypothetical protein [Micropruina sp.]